MIKMPPTQVEFIGFEGGLDLVTPPLMVPPGRCRQAQNFEIDTLGGYKRCLGYERYDGRSRPSDASAIYTPINLTGAIPLGSTVTGSVSGATGVAIAVASDRLLTTKMSGTFSSGEDVLVSGTPRALTTASSFEGGGDSQEQRALYRSLAADAYRADIQAVPGEGAILGVKYFQGSLYAIRKKVGVAEAGWYVDSPSGWSALTFGEEVSFTNANVNVEDGDTITQGGVTATIQRVVVQTGTLVSGTNTGRLIVTGRSGGSFSAGAATTTGGGSLTVSSVQTAITFTSGGRFKFETYNFALGDRLYGCDGLNRAFEFDGTVMVPLTTGMPVDAPHTIATHKNHLFLGFDSSIQHSAIGDPYSWTAISGAGELNLGARVTGLMPMPSDNIAGGSMACFTTQRTYLLYGSSSADWQLVTQRDDIGAQEHSVQFIDTAYFLDLRGVSSLSATDRFGNFAAASLSALVRPFVIENKSRILDSCVVKDKNQYRVLFQGGRMLVMTLQGNGGVGFMPMSFPDSMVLLEQSEDETGAEVVFYADSDGYVYQAEKGTSFDGQSIEAFMLLSFNHSKQTRVFKQYRKVVFEVGATGYAKFNFSAELNYQSTETPQFDSEEVGFGADAPGGGVWDSGVWDVGSWDGASLLPAELPLTGVAQNISMRISQFAAYHEPLTFYGGLLHYTPRRQMR